MTSKLCFQFRFFYEKQALLINPASFWPVKRSPLARDAETLAELMSKAKKYLRFWRIAIAYTFVMLY